MHPNQSPKAEVSDKPDAWLLTDSKGVVFAITRDSSKADEHDIPLYRRATDERVAKLVEASKKARQSLYDTTQPGEYHWDVGCELQSALDALAGVKADPPKPEDKTP